MQYSMIKACLLALAATTSVVAQTAGFNVLTKPAEKEVLAAGKPYTIEWQPTFPSQKVSLVVIQGTSNVTLQIGATIASGIESAAGKFEWAVPADASYAVYGVKLQLDSNPDVFQYSNQFMIDSAIAKPETTTVKLSTIPAVVAPTPIVDNVVQPTLAPAGQATLTQYRTIINTITSCAPTVTDCPYGKQTSTVIPVVPTAPAEPVAPYPVSSNGTTVAESTTVMPLHTAPAASVPVLTTLMTAPFGNGTATYVAPPANTAPVVSSAPVVVPGNNAGETPAAPSVPASPAAPAVSAAPSAGGNNDGEMFTGAASSVAVSSLSVLGAVAVSFMLL